MIKSNHIISLLLNMSLKLIIWLKCSKTKTPLIPVLNLNHLITKKYLPPSTRKRNAQRLNQWKAKRIETVVYTKVNTEAQTENRNTQIDETTQIDQQCNHDQVQGRIQDFKLGGALKKNAPSRGEARAGCAPLDPPLKSPTNHPE